MKNFILKTILFTSVIILFTRCNDYLDVNTPSESVPEEELNMRDIFAPIELNYTFANYEAQRVLGNYVQNFGSYGADAAGPTEADATWSLLYTTVLPNIKVVKKKADALNATHFKAVAQIIEVMSITLAVDLWDKVPYSQIGKPLEYTQPVFDDGKEVYNKAILLLNESISALENPDPSDIKIQNDLFYKGSTKKWLKAAYTYKARLQLHMMKNGGTTAADVLASINKGFTSNADDMELNFPKDKFNGYYVYGVARRVTGNSYIAPNDQLISLLNGSTYPFESGTIKIDPRLPLIFQRQNSDREEIDDDTTPWRGFMNGGEGQSSDGEPANTFYFDGGFYSEEQAPLVLMSYAEAMFIKAEAEFLVNGGTTTSTGTNENAYQAYLKGIEANMNKLKAKASDYLADTGVNVGKANLMLNHIMKEKYIANIHNTETYNDFRRYNFSSDVFKGLALRLEESGSGDYAGKWFRRAVYPSSERATNQTNVEANYKEPIISVWWAE